MFFVRIHFLVVGDPISIAPPISILLSCGQIDLVCHLLFLNFGDGSSLFLVQFLLPFFFCVANMYLKLDNKAIVFTKCSLQINQGINTKLTVVILYWWYFLSRMRSSSMRWFLLSTCCLLNSAMYLVVYCLPRDLCKWSLRPCCDVSIQYLVCEKQNRFTTKLHKGEMRWIILFSTSQHSEHVLHCVNSDLLVPLAQHFEWVSVTTSNRRWWYDK